MKIIIKYRLLSVGMFSSSLLVQAAEKGKSQDIAQQEIKRGTALSLIPEETQYEIN